MSIDPVTENVSNGLKRTETPTPKTILQKIYAHRSVKLALVLVALFIFFGLARGIQEGVKGHLSNRDILKKLEEKGVPEEERLSDPGLTSPLRSGFNASKSFLRWHNLETIFRQTSIVGLAALGMTLVIISGGIDLSVGSIVALGTVVIAWFLKYAGWDPLAAAVAAVVVCALCGMLNGVLITGLRVVPFIVTLGMMLIVRGAAKGLAHEQKIDAPDTWLTGLMGSLTSDQKWMLFPPGVWIWVVASILVAVLLRYTRLGRHTFAIGSNELTARLCGVPVERMKVIIYTLCGVFAGMAGLMQLSRLTVGDPTVAVGLELDVIAAVVIGGGSLSGGEGSILGSVVGALIMTVIATGCSQMGLPNWVQEIITGIIIIVAVAMDSLRHRREA